MGLLYFLCLPAPDLYHLFKRLDLLVIRLLLKPIQHRLKVFIARFKDQLELGLFQRPELGTIGYNPVVPGQFIGFF